MPFPVLHRGVVFSAEHDNTYTFWHDDDPQKKYCSVFNAEPLSDDGDVHYFLATSNVSRYRESPSLLSDVLILPLGSYEFFDRETVLDFRELCIVPLQSS